MSFKEDVEKLLKKLAGPNPTNDQKDAITELAGILTKAKERGGVLESVDVSTSAAAASQFSVETTSRILSDLPQQFINFDIASKRSTTYNQEFLKAITNTRDQIVSLSQKTAEYGIGVRDNFEIYKEYLGSHLKILPIFKEEIVKLTEFTSKMKAFGVETADSTETIEKLTQKLDLNGDQLEDTRKRLVSFATQTNQSVKEVNDSYRRSISSFMDYLDPQKMDEAFMKFQIMSRRMGTEASSLFSLAEKFDTLDTAQETGARLNQTFSALGVEFNALALQEMEPEQRVAYISDKVREGLAVARTMSTRDQRLFMGSLMSSGAFSSKEEIRAFEAEGGMRRAGDFEKGGLKMLTPEEELEMARKYNFGKLDAAQAERRAYDSFMKTETYKTMKDFLGKFDESVEKFERALRTPKDLLASVATRKFEETVGKDLARAVGVLTGEGKLDAQDKQKLKDAGIDTTNINKIQDLVVALAQKSAADQAAASAAAENLFNLLGTKLEESMVEAIRKLLAHR